MAIVCSVINHCTLYSLCKTFKIYSHHLTFIADMIFLLYRRECSSDSLHVFVIFVSLAGLTGPRYSLPVRKTYIYIIMICKLIVTFLK